MLIILRVIGLLTSLVAANNRYKEKGIFMPYALFWIICYLISAIILTKLAADQFLYSFHLINISTFFLTDEEHFYHSISLII